MKFLKERGYIYTKTGHGTSVAEQYGTLAALEKAFLDQFKLENFPLPRLSKTHLEKVDTRQYHYGENLKSTRGSMSDYSYQQEYGRVHHQPPPQYTMWQHPSANGYAYNNNTNHNNFYQDDNTGKKPVASIPMGAYYYPNEAMMSVSPPPYFEQPVARRIPSESVSLVPPSAPIPSGLQALTVAAQSELSSGRRHSAPECPLPAMTYSTPMKPPTVDQFLPNHRMEFPVLPPLTNITSQLPSEDSSKLSSYPKSSIHSLLHTPVPAQNRPRVDVQNRPKTLEADLFQSFCEHLYHVETSSDGSSRKRSIELPPVTEDQSKKSKGLDYESQWYPPPHAILS